MYKDDMHMYQVVCPHQFLYQLLCIVSSDYNFIMRLKLTRWNVMQFHVQLHTDSVRDYNLSIHEIRRK